MSQIIHSSTINNLISVQNHSRTRTLPIKKTILFSKHLNLINSSNLLLFLRPGDFDSSEWSKLRTNLNDIIHPKSSPSSAIPSPLTTTTTNLKLTVLRPGLLPALIRSNQLNSSLDLSLLSQQSHLKGPLAVLTSNELNPLTLTKILKLLNAFSLTPSKNSPPLDLKSKIKPKPIERLEILSSLIESQAFNLERTKSISNLPSLDILRSQIVGLLSAPGARITGVLSTRARQVSLTLEGFKEGLKPVEAVVGEAGGAEK